MMKKLKKNTNTKAQTHYAAQTHYFQSLKLNRLTFEGAWEKRVTVSIHFKIETW